MQAPSDWSECCEDAGTHAAVCLHRSHLTTQLTVPPGSFYVGVGAMLFGAPTRFWQLDPARASKLLDPAQPEAVHRPSQAWDDVLQASSCLACYSCRLA